MALIKLQPTPIEEVNVPFDRPYFLKGFCKDMLAIDKWNDDTYLRANFNNVEFDVETYKSKKDFETSKSGMETQKFNEYFKQMSEKNIYIPDCDLMEYSDEIEDCIFEDLINPNDWKLGLKNRNNEVGVPDGCNLYIGVDTKTGMHCHIEDDFMLNQIIGTKRVYTMGDFSMLNMKPLFNKYNNFSKENFFELDWYKIVVYYADLEPGDSFCFTPWTWHAIKSDGYTLGMTKVWERKDQHLLYKGDDKWKPLRRRNFVSVVIPHKIQEWIKRVF